MYQWIEYVVVIVNIKAKTDKNHLISWYFMIVVHRRLIECSIKHTSEQGTKVSPGVKWFMVCVSIQLYVEQWTFLKLCKNIYAVCLKSHSIVVFFLFLFIIYVLLCRSIWMYHKQSYGDVDMFALWIVNVSSHFTWIIVMSFKC